LSDRQRRTTVREIASYAPADCRRNAASTPERYGLACRQSVIDTHSTNEDDDRCQRSCTTAPVSVTTPN
jgi:hypothetical protein